MQVAERLHLLPLSGRSCWVVVTRSTFRVIIGIIIIIILALAGKKVC